MPVVTYKGLGDHSDPIPPKDAHNPWGIDDRGQAHYWVVRSGKRVRIEKMGDQHLVNTLHMLERNAPKFQRNDLDRMWEFYTTLQGEMAQYYAEQELLALETDDAAEWLAHAAIYQALCDEALRRRLYVRCPECGSASRDGRSCWACSIYTDPSDDPAHDHG
jgi:hypothetical protein